MDNENPESQAEMGVSEAGPSSVEPLSFADLERVISSLFDDNWDENTSTAEPETISEIFAVDKLDYFYKVAASVMEAKNNFLRAYDNATKSLADLTREVIMGINLRKDELTQELRSIKFTKIGKWDHQLTICHEAIRQIRKKRTEGTHHSTFAGVTHLQQHLKMIEGGPLQFEVDNYHTFFRDLRHLGMITSQTGLTWCNPENPSYIDVVPKFKFGSSGGGPGEFCRPWGVCSDATGRILVCDRSNNRIQIFNENGKFLLQFGEEGSEPGQFNRPSGIAVDKYCRIIIADKDNHRIQVFSYSGSYIFRFGSHGTEVGQFDYPWDVSVNRNCDIAVSDSKNHRIQLFNQRGVFITLFDAAKAGIVNPRAQLKFLDSPRGLAFRPDGCLLATDFNNHKIFLITQNFTNYVTFGGEGTSQGRFFRPQGIACDKDGSFVVADCKNYRVQEFDRDGNVVTVFGSQGTEGGQFDCPQGISYHPAQNILVVDMNNCRVQVF